MQHTLYKQAHIYITEHTFLLFNCAKKHVSLHIYPFPPLTATQTQITHVLQVLIFILPPGIPARTVYEKMMSYVVAC